MQCNLQKQWNSSPISSQQSGSSGFDETVDWDLEGSTEQYVVKPKTVKPFIPKQGILGYEAQNLKSSQTCAPSSKWLETTLAQGPPQQSVTEMNEVFRHLERQWAHGSIKDKTPIVQYLSKQFSHSVNPYILVNFLIRKTEDIHIGKTTTLSFLIMKEFDKWCKGRQGRLNIRQYVTRDVQMEIFDISTRHHLTMFDMAVKCFGLCYPGNDLFLPLVKQFLTKKKYKEVRCSHRASVMQDISGIF